MTDDPPHGTMRDTLRRKASFWETARAVLWAFFGVRKGKGYRQDVERLNPVHVIIMGIALAAVFVLVLIGIVRWVTS